MKKELKNVFKSPIILSDLDLSGNDFSDAWLRGFFINPIIENLTIFNSQKDLVQMNVYLGFTEIEVVDDSRKNKNFYKKLHAEFKKIILKDWEKFGVVKPLYGFHRIKSNKDGMAKYLVIYLSPNKSNSVFDFSLIYRRDKLISNVFDLLLKAHLLQKSNSSNPISFDVVSGKVFLEPEVKKRKEVDGVQDSDSDTIEKKSVSAFSFNFTYDNFIFKHGIKHEVYVIEKTKDGLDIYDDFCHINNYKYGRKKDAREMSRPFFSFKNYDTLKYSRYIAQVRIYKNILETFDKHKISYKKTYFTPEYIYSDFPEIKSDIKHVNIFVNETELGNYEKYLSTLKIKQEFSDILKYLKDEMGLEYTIYLNPVFEDIFNRKDECNLFLMFGDDYNENYVTFNKESEKESWKSPLDPFMEKKLYGLPESDFMEILKGFDLYSQIKIYTLYANKNSLKPIVSQGLILNGQELKEIKKEKDEKIGKDKDGKYTYNDVEVYSTSLKSILMKIVNELNIKRDLYVNKYFNFKSSFDNISQFTPIEKVKIVNKYPKKDFKIYSHVDLQRIDGKYVVQKYEILLEDELKKLNFESDISSDLLVADSLLIIDEEYLIKVKDNELMPKMIMEFNRFDVPGKDLMDIMDKSVIDDVNKPANNKSKPLKTAKPGENVCYPYNVLAVSSMVKEKESYMSGNHNAMLDFSNNGLKVFMTLKTQGVKEKIEKNNRLEELEIFKLVDFTFEKVNWRDNELLMNFYLSSIPFNYMSINAITKKSLLTKIGDVVLLN